MNVESILDSLQVEWSTSLHAILDHFLSAMLKSRTNRADSSAAAPDLNQLSGQPRHTEPAEVKLLNLSPSHVTQQSSNTAHVSQPTQTIQQLKVLMKNAFFNIQCSNLNLYTCHEQIGKKLVKC